MTFFQDPCYAYMNEIILSTSTLPSDIVQIGGFAPVNPMGYGVGYAMKDTWLGLQISTYPTRDGKQMVQHMEQVLDDLHAVITSDT